MIECKYGHFSEDGKEYVITNPLTPRPWVNVISNGEYSAVVSQMGGGYSFRYNAEQCRITRAYQDLIKDNWGKYFYIRNVDSGEYWSATYLPVSQPLDSYVVRHGIGYSVFERTTNGIASRLTCFVSADKPMEYLSLQLVNTSDKPMALDVTGYFEWAPGIAYDTHREFQKLFVTTAYDDKLNAILLNKCLWGFPDAKGRWNNDDWPFTAFFAASEQMDSFDCDKESFIGMYNDEKTPAALRNKHLANRSGRYCDCVGALRSKVITLQPNDSKTLVFSIGIARHQQEDVKQLIQACSVNRCEQELAAVSKMWNKLIFSAEHVDTPDVSFNLMTNIWSKYQALSGRMWGKCGYYQISGGIGYRDQLQDSLVMLENNPEYTKKQILLHASRQFQAGDVQHWWLQIGGAGPRTKCSDDYLWLVFAVNRYIEETADYSILDISCPFVDGGQADSLYQHCVRALRLAYSRLSPRGVALMGDHDWNDGLSAVGNDMKGESFWVSEFLYELTQRFIPSANKRGDDEFALQLNKNAANLQRAFEQHGWDGNWYLQATCDDGTPLGSASCSEGAIFLNPQVWAVISGIGNAVRQEQAMNSVTEKLLKDYGALLLTPEYRQPNANIGYITRYAPGLRENGGVYTHAATWAVWAYAKLGDASNAYKAYSRICPPNRSKDIDVYFSEPYVLCGNSDGPISPHYGRGGWSWYTGSAQWLHNVAVQWILGVRPTLDGLLIEPCIPDHWQGYKYKRTFRNAVYNISVSRGESKGITLDGERINGNVLPIANGGQHEVTVVI